MFLIFVLPDAKSRQSTKTYMPNFQTYQRLVFVQVVLAVSAEFVPEARFQFYSKELIFLVVGLVLLVVVRVPGVIRAPEVLCINTLLGCNSSS